MCANRFLIQDRVHDEFVRRLVDKVKTLKTGDGMRDDSQVGPLIDHAAVERIEALVAEAVAGGARVVAGGQRHAAGPNFYQPTVLTEVDPGMDICGDEILGPVASVIRFKEEAEALTLANQGRSGLAAYFYTSDLNRSFRVLEALECGRGRRERKPRLQRGRAVRRRQGIGPRQGRLALWRRGISRHQVRVLRECGLNAAFIRVSSLVQRRLAGRCDRPIDPGAVRKSGCCNSRI